MTPAYRTRAATGQIREIDDEAMEDNFDTSFDIHGSDNNGEVYGREQGGVAGIAREAPADPTRPAIERPTATADDELEEARARVKRLAEFAELMEVKAKAEQRIAKLTATAKPSTMSIHSIPKRKSQGDSTPRDRETERDDMTVDKPLGRRITSAKCPTCPSSIVRYSGKSIREYKIWQIRLNNHFDQHPYYFVDDVTKICRGVEVLQGNMILAWDAHVTLQVVPKTYAEFTRFMQSIVDYRGVAKEYEGILQKEGGIRPLKPRRLRNRQRKNRRHRNTRPAA
ncbi:hypothetical protein PENPOL_c003G08353 [Penicillium polonicum]|uniref:Uncharacterized protein n=1 Tax=Penicillium polonicum TaxID=60169 RepID=A0A1V6NTR8_PENPO|nr:hypothetical protein PENPOL_c003G08353 [Penicillium polonicum]